MDFRETGFDRYSPVIGTEAEIELNKEKLANYELALATDSDKLAYKDENGIIHYVGSAKDSVDTIEDLKLVKASVGEVYSLKGYYSAGDGASHQRIIAATDDGSGILLDNGLYANIVHNGEVNVSWFGAKGDGVTDDTTMIQKAIIYNDVVKFNSGNFIIKETINLTNKNIAGTGDSSRLTFTENKAAIIIDSTSVVENLYLLGDATTFHSNGSGIYLPNNSAQLTKLRNLKIRGFDKGINYRGGNSQRWENIYLEKNNVGLEVNPTSTQDCNGSICLGLRAYASFDTGVKFLQGDSSVGGNNGSSMGTWNITTEGGKNGIEVIGGRFNKFDLYSETNTGKDYIITASENIYILKNPDNDIVDSVSSCELTYTYGGRLYKKLPLISPNISLESTTDSTKSIQNNPVDIYIIQNTNNTASRGMRLDVLQWIQTGATFEIVFPPSSTPGWILQPPTNYILKGDTSSVGAYAKNYQRVKVIKDSNNSAIIFRQDCVQVPSTLESLNTPYHATKMQQEGILDEYYQYLDAKNAYDQQQRELENQRQLAFENRENKEQTYEEWLSTQPMMLPVETEPQPSERLLEFAKRYNIV